jgi:hypothetical protein
MAARIEESAAKTSKNFIEEEKHQTIFLLYTEQQMNCNKSKNTLWNISYFASLLLIYILFLRTYMEKKP